MTKYTVDLFILHKYAEFLFFFMPMHLCGSIFHEENFETCIFFLNSLGKKAGDFMQSVSLEDNVK